MIIFTCIDFWNTKYRSLHRLIAALFISWKRKLILLMVSLFKWCFRRRGLIIVRIVFDLLFNTFVLKFDAFSSEFPVLKCFIVRGSEFELLNFLFLQMLLVPFLEYTIQLIFTDWKSLVPVTINQIFLNLCLFWIDLSKRRLFSEIFFYWILVGINFGWIYVAFYLLLSHFFFLFWWTSRFWVVNDLSVFV